MITSKHDVKRAINNIIREKGRFPVSQELCDALNFSADQTKKCMQSLVEDGYLDQNGDWFKYPLRPKILPETTPEIIYEKPEKELEITEIESLKLSKPQKEEKEDGTNIENAQMELGISMVGSKMEYIPENKNEEKIELINISSPKKRGRPIGKKQKAEEFISLNQKKGKIEEDISLYGLPVYIIQLTMGIIGIGAAIISIYYTTIWLLEFLPWAFALLLSSIMVGFSVSAFETVILFMTGQVTKSRTARVSITSGFVILWLIVSAFSIMSTVAGQYNKHVMNLRDQAKQGINTGKASWNVLQEKKKLLQIRLNQSNKNIDLLGKVAAKLDSESASWNQTQYQLQQESERLSKLSIEMNSVQDEEQRQIEGSKKTGVILSSTDGKDTVSDIPDFYGWMSNITGVMKDKVQFWMSLFPAVFCDILAPVGLAISLFLRNKYKKVQGS